MPMNFEGEFFAIYTGYPFFRKGSRAVAQTRMAIVTGMVQCSNGACISNKIFTST